MDMSARPTGWERVFWSAFNRSKNAMSLLDDQRMRVATNQALCDLLQRPRDWLIGRPVDETFAPHEAAGLAVEWRRFLQVGDWTGDRDVMRADGLLVRVQYAARATDIGGRTLILFVAIEQDVDAIAPQTARAELTPRERAVVHLITHGLTTTEIADRLSISRATARTHVSNAMAKTGARTRAQLVAIALADRHIDGLEDPVVEASRDDADPGNTRLSQAEPQ